MTGVRDRLGHLELLARLGYGARGTVYLIVGGLTLATAWSAGRPTDTEGALREILSQPNGRIALALMALGLLAHAAWRFAQSGLDLDDHGTSAKGLAIRAGMAVSGIVHVGSALFAAALVMGVTGWGMEESGGGSPDWTAWAMRQPFGRWAVGAVGLVILGVAAALLQKAWTAGFVRHLACGRDKLSWICAVGRVGLAAKAVVFLITGGFALMAAWRIDPSEAGGLMQALLWLERQPFGPWLLALLAAGLFAFGVYGLIQAAFRRIDAPQVMARLKPAV